MQYSTQNLQMKVIILTGEPFPNGMAATNRIKCYARAIKEGGLECEVVVFRRTERYGSKPLNTIGQDLLNGIPFRYVGGTPLRGGNPFLRQLNDRIDLWRTDRYLRRILMKGDILFFFMGGYVQLMLRYMRIAHAKGAFCVRDLCELPFGVGAESKRAILLRKVTFEKQFPRLDGIISISDALLNLARTYTLPACKHIKVPIMVDFDQYYLPDNSTKAGMPYIFHSGTLYQQKDGILGIIEAFGMAIKKISFPVKFISTGELDKSPHRDELKRLIAKYHLEDRLQFTGYLSHEDLKDYLSKSSMVIINKYHNQQNTYCFSTKLGEYLAAAKPVVITNVGEVVNWLENGKSAYVIKPKDSNALANAIVQVFNNPDKARLIGRAGQQLCQRSFDYRVWSKPLVDFMKQIGN